MAVQDEKSVVRSRCKQFVRKLNPEESEHSDTEEEDQGQPELGKDDVSMNSKGPII